MSAKTAIGKGLQLFFDNIRSIIALLVVTCSFGFLFFVVTKPVPVGNQALVNTAAGLVLAGLGGVVGYYFGSSKNETDAAKATQ